MAAVVYLMVMLQSSCASTCTAPDVSTNRKVAIADKSMADEDAGNRNIRQLVNRIDRLGEAVSRMQNDVTELDAYCRTIRPRDDTPTRVVTSSALSPKDVAALQKVPKLETFTRGLDAKLTRFMTQPQDVCQESHYRYGLYCYVIAEAGLSQSDARNWCTADFGSQASLAVVFYVSHPRMTSLLRHYRLRRCGTARSSIRMGRACKGMFGRCGSHVRGIPLLGTAPQ
uniref:Uncharacterized protein n=1 Tax=Ciona savignyi TaxID=51511 RepID=H2Y5R5_CIOSA